MPRLSVAMCTFQGEKFLEAQLASILAQRSPPDRMVVVDDRSTDQTLELVRSFAHSAPFPVEVLQNPRTLGFTKNFERAIGAADGELIVLSDQDDVWAPTRLEEVRQIFRDAPDVGAVFSDAELVDAELNPLGSTLFEAVGFTPALQRLARRRGMFDVLLKGNVVTGATLAFRSEFRDLVLPISETSEHDAWIALMIAAVAPVVFVPRPLLRYRQHSANQIGAEVLGLGARLNRAREQRLDGLVRQRARACAALDRLASASLDGEKRATLRQSIAHLEVRSTLPDRRRLRVMPVMRELVRGRYQRLSRGVASACRDLIA